MLTADCVRRYDKVWNGKERMGLEGSGGILRLWLEVLDKDPKRQNKFED